MQEVINFKSKDDVQYIRQTDTYDTGLHLNVYGAEKAASWFGKVLQEQCNVPDRRNDTEVAALWAEKAKTYHDRKAALEAQEQ